MPKTEYIISISELALRGEKSKLLDLINKIAAEEINKNHHTIYNGLIRLINKYSESEENYHGQNVHRSQIENDIYGYLPDSIWLPKKIESQLKLFLDIYRYREHLQKNNFSNLNKILLYGPPGTGKTTLGFYIAKLLNKRINYIKISDILSSRFGETLKNISDIFNDDKCDIIFIDEFDAIGKSRKDANDVGELKRIVNSVIQILDFQSSKKVIIVSTNLIESLDTAILRRFPTKILVDELEINEAVVFFKFLLETQKQIINEIPEIDLDFFIGLLNLKTIDELRSFYEKLTIFVISNNGGILTFDNLINFLIDDGLISKAKLKKIRKSQQEILFRFAQYLKSQGYNQIEIADLFGIHRNSYKNYFNKSVCIKNIGT